MALITLQQAKDHLRVDNDDMDMDIELKLEAVSEMVLRFTQEPVDTYPLDSSGISIGVPFAYKAAAMIWLGILFKQRDGGADESLSFGEVPRTVSALLYQYRQPSVAGGRAIYDLIYPPVVDPIP